MFCNTFSRHTLSSLTPSHTSMSSANMNGNFDNTSPPVFMVDSGGGYPKQRQYYHEQVHGRTDPVLVPCWTFPPARAEDKRRGCGGMNVVITWILALILLLVFAALGLGAYQILRLQSELERLTQKIPTQIQSFVPQRQVGLKPAELDKTKRKVAAHLIGYADQNKSSRTLKWEVRHGEAFTDGVKYINGGLQVNETEIAMRGQSWKIIVMASVWRGASSRGLQAVILALFNISSSSTGCLSMCHTPICSAPTIIIVILASSGSTDHVGPEGED
ncbi:uncharacterized protein LOC127416109 isoform X2 [Myxocyprinus asiaticus]|uniref:uncharacterized protein LOC127416109 isoform X2 n=1 Tax=Myxocyprinus asiaticus TaxID=70543 RepID=UPI002221BC48|nr:uncharacterized protein LOC127416109 isoform X2 [Myxocyprinus asiaticus]